MSPEETFAIQQTVRLLKKLLNEAFAHIRPDSRGDGMRIKKSAIEDELNRLELFVMNEVKLRG